LPINLRLTAARNRLRLAHPTGGDVTPASEAFVDRDRAMGRDTSGDFNGVAAAVDAAAAASPGLAPAPERIRQGPERTWNEE